MLSSAMFACSTLLFLFICCSCLFQCLPLVSADNGDELLLVQALWRHGDRSPTGTFKTDIYQEDQWPQGWGQLSPRGMAQHVKLGKQLRARYVEKLGFLSKHYNSHEIYVRSTDFNRTLISAISNFIGFYGPGSDADYPKELGNSDWPGWYVPIAVHTISGREDFIAPGEPECHRQEELRELMSKTPEYRNAMGEYKWLMDLLREKTGEKMADPFACWFIGDALFIEKVNKLKLADWVEGNDTLYEQIKKCERMALGWLNGLGLSSVDGFDFRKEIPKIRGGPMLWKLIGNMEDKMKCQHRMNRILGPDREIRGRKSPLGGPICQWMNRIRYFAYSAHDSTIAALLSALGFAHTNYDLDGVPPYTACVTVELWTRNGGQHYLKVLYWRPDKDGNVQNVEITKDIEGCPTSGGECTLEQFIERSKPYQMLPSPQAYCQQPLKRQPQANSALARMAMNSLWKILMAGQAMAITIIIIHTASSTTTR